MMDLVSKDTSEQIQSSGRNGLILKSCSEEQHIYHEGTAEDFSREARAVWKKLQKRYNTQTRSRDTKWHSARTANIQDRMRDTSFNIRGYHGNVIPTAPPVDELDTVIVDYTEQTNALREQLALIQSRKEYIEQNKESERKKVTEFFTIILEVLAGKETQILKQLEEGYKNEERKLKSLLTSVEVGLATIKTEMVVAANVKTKDGHSRTGPIKEMKLILSDIKAKYEERKQELGKQDVDTVKVNQAAVDTVSELTYVTLTDIADETDTHATTETDRDEQGSGREISDTTNRSLSGGEGREISDTTNRPLSRAEGREISDTTIRPLSGAESLNVMQQNVVNNNAVGFVDIPSNSGAVISELPNYCIFTGNLLTADVRPCPSAPVEPPEPPPPSYIEAIGLGSPETRNATPRAVSIDPTSRSVSSSYTPIRRSNQRHVFCLQNISLSEQNDAKLPKPVAIIWKFGKVYVADKANGAIKLCTPADGVLPEKHWADFEMYDIAVLETTIDGLRIVISSPRSLRFITVDGHNSRDVKVRQVELREGYTSVAKGPSNNTIVGANALPNIGNPRVDIVDLSGQVVKSFAKTPSRQKFAYPRCVEVFSDKIIVADWKLNLVAVLHEDGHDIGQYSGTRLHPLKEPISLTLDHVGNPMVLSGRTGNVHVMDLQCRPLEIIKFPAGESVPMLIAYDKDTHRIAGVRPSGVIAIYDSV